MRLRCRETLTLGILIVTIFFWMLGMAFRDELQVNRRLEAQFTAFLKHHQVVYAEQHAQIAALETARDALEQMLRRLDGTVDRALAPTTAQRLKALSGCLAYETWAIKQENPLQVEE